MNLVIRKPVMSEKSSEALNKSKYTFIVRATATKAQIFHDFNFLYCHSLDGSSATEIVIDKINTMNYEGKKKMRHSRKGSIYGAKPSYKKAVITLKSGEIDIYSLPKGLEVSIN